MVVGCKMDSCTTDQWKTEVGVRAELGLPTYCGVVSEFGGGLRVKEPNRAKDTVVCAKEFEKGFRVHAFLRPRTSGSN